MPVDVSAPNAPRAGAFLVSSRAVLWRLLDSVGFWTGRIGGVWLPSVRRFTATLRRFLNPREAIPLLDARRLYVVNARGVLWAATLSP